MKEVAQGNSNTLDNKRVSHTIHLSPEDNHRLAVFCGQYDEHLQRIQSRLNVNVNQRGFTLSIRGKTDAVNHAVKVIQTLYAETEITDKLTLQDVDICLQAIAKMPAAASLNDSLPAKAVASFTQIGKVKSRGVNQALYLKNIESHDVNFGIGPSGTGKTYLAVAAAVNALQREEVARIILVRPAVEAGEHLGFLPGDLAEKVDPYLRPLYDALYELLGFEKVERFIERQVIEIAPLAFMRGRTLNNAFIILDESQNTTEEQMKMFLTRIGFGSKVVVTGDITQVDLPRERLSGLKHAIDVLKDIKGISFTYFEPKDVVRHNLVQLIVEAYERYNRLRNSDF